jgi:hypothetical protein
MSAVASPIVGTRVFARAEVPDSGKSDRAKPFVGFATIRFRKNSRGSGRMSDSGRQYGHFRYGIDVAESDSEESESLSC